MTRTTTAFLLTVAAAVGIGPAAATVAAGTQAGSTQIARADFAHPQANPWFPLRPGTTTILRGTDEGEHLRERVHVTYRTKVIEGVRTRVVTDVLRRDNRRLAERTTDWYAADGAGNVWYFGEATATYDEKGHLESREGSWQAGLHGARAGMIMPARPHPTQAFRQEFLRGHAEDQAWIVGNSTRTKTPMGTFGHVVRSFEWTRLEPGVLSLKLYAPGVGIVKERDMSGGSETFQVVAVHRP
ncbi:hypothetical protein [Marmoricola sp. URHB0036]|uniref:hypothetical protein n=1 Tax=Marmoricola sp. URHB0036 TaxID=1298863 RepID=UPI0012DF9748|nr:hypothetical protein [Marmoricola sp. URHB0036]